jgi:hypothetical protein
MVSLHTEARTLNGRPEIFGLRSDWSDANQSKKSETHQPQPDLEVAELPVRFDILKEMHMHRDQHVQGF